jgi:hypothetical protein
MILNAITNEHLVNCHGIKINKPCCDTMLSGLELGPICIGWVGANIISVCDGLERIPMD